ncbi:MAG TPA: hypothetical protein VHB47_16340 [Thermoanaerobaculia bacterium]|nr:hypothetical protein [Thermoanaerobaculia bacterium]
MLLAAENGRAQLTFMNAATGLTAFEFQHQGNQWTKATNVPVEKLLGLRVGDDGQWQQAFGGPYPKKAADWSRFWNGWLDHLSQLKGDERLNLPGGSGGMRQALLQRVSESEWRDRFARAMPVLLGRAAPLAASPVAAAPPALTASGASDAAGPAESAGMTSNLSGGAAGGTGQASHAWPLLWIAAAVAVAVVASWLFRGWLTARWRSWHSRADAAAEPTTPQAEVVVLAAVLDRLYQAAARKITDEASQSADAATLGSQALAFALGRFQAAAVDAGILQHRVAAETPPAAEATPGRADRDRRGKRDKDKLAAVSEDLKRERKRTEQLETERQVLTAERDDLARREGKHQAEVRELAAYKRQGTQDQQTIDTLSASQRNLTKELNDARQAVATADERHRVALAAKDLGLLALKADYERDLTGARGKVNSLNNELATERRAHEAAAARMGTLERALEQERQRHANDVADLQVFREKMDRIEHAGQFLRQAQLGYWDRCQHFPSTAAVLYTSYLGLYQALAGAFQKQALHESAGWTNIWNLLQRLAEVPGLERWRQEFARGVYPEIEQQQLTERQVVDPGKQDKEQFVQSMVLQGLLTGEVQLDGDRRDRFSLDRMRRWPLYFRVEGEQVWGAA